MSPATIKTKLAFLNSFLIFAVMGRLADFRYDSEYNTSLKSLISSFQLIQISIHLTPPIYE